MTLVFFVQAQTPMSDPTKEEETRFEALLNVFDDLKRSKRVTAIRATDPFQADLRTASKTELRDREMAVVDAEARYLAPGQLDQVDTLLRSPGGDLDGSVVAKRILLTENANYRSAFMKAVTQNTPAFTPEEVRALTSSVPAPWPMAPTASVALASPCSSTPRSS